MMRVFWQFFDSFLLKTYVTILLWKIVFIVGDEMAIKYEHIDKLFKENLQKILTNKIEFIKFVKFCSKFYKYDFKDILCIYSQKMT